MSLDRSGPTQPDLWSMLGQGGEGTTRPDSKQSAKRAQSSGPLPSCSKGNSIPCSPHRALENSTVGHTPYNGGGGDKIGDWSEALQQLQDGLQRHAAITKWDDARPRITLEQVAAPARPLLPAVTWRVLALLAQVKPQGAILFLPIGEQPTPPGGCSLCGEELPPACESVFHLCELCAVASRLALGFQSLSDWLCGGGSLYEVGTGECCGRVTQQFLDANIEEGAPEG
jgi:hypothetical protein